MLLPVSEHFVHDVTALAVLGLGAGRAVKDYDRPAASVLASLVGLVAEKLLNSSHHCSLEIIMMFAVVCV